MVRQKPLHLQNQEFLAEHIVGAGGVVEHRQEPAGARLEARQNGIVQQGGLRLVPRPPRHLEFGDLREQARLRSGRHRRRRRRLLVPTDAARPAPAMPSIQLLEVPIRTDGSAVDVALKDFLGLLPQPAAPGPVLVVERDDAPDQLFRQDVVERHLPAVRPLPDPRDGQKTPPGFRPGRPLGEFPVAHQLTPGVLVQALSHDS